MTQVFQKFFAFFLIFVNILLISFKINALESEPADFKIIVGEYSDKATIGLRININEGWKLYSNEPGDSGMPLSISFSDKHNLSESKIIWPEGEFVEHDGFITNVYTNTVLIPLILQPIDTDKPINGSMIIDYGACKEYCTRAEKKIDFSILPQFKDATNIASIKGAINPSIKSNHDYNAQTIPLYIAIAFAIIGGFILNLMPCVLPIITLKIIGLVKISHLSLKETRLNLLLSALGIIVSFIFLACFTQLLKMFGHQVGWGGQFQDPRFIIFLIYILILFASNLNGDFEISLPQTLMQRLNVSNTQVSHFYSFLTGMFATLLATPCTAPFLSIAIAFGLTQDFEILLTQYFFIGLGMSLPFLLLAINPKWVGLLPKGGVWMFKLKKFFAILLIITALWLFYVLYYQVIFSCLLTLCGSILIMKAVITDDKWLKDWRIKISLSIIIVILSYIGIAHLQNREVLREEYVSHLWENFSEKRIEEYVKEGNIVFVDVTAEWCLTCKFNKFTVLDRDAIIDYFVKNNIKLMRADYTNPSKEIQKYIIKFGRNGIPMNVIYGPKKPNGQLLNELISIKSITKEVDEIR